MNLKKAFSVKGYDQLDLYYQEHNLRGITLENNKIKNFECDVTGGVGIRAIVKGKIGFAYTTNLKKLIETVKQAITVAKFSNQNVTLKSYSKYKRPKGLFDKNVLKVGDRELISSLNKAISFAKKNKAIAAGGLNLSESSTSYLNSEGLDLEEKDTEVSTSMDIIYKGVEASWYDERRKYKDMVLPTITKSLNLAKQMSVKGNVKTGKYDVIFHPFALSQILSYGLYPSFDADFVQKGKSKLATKMSKKVFDEKLTINDNGLLEGGLSSETFDGDGVPVQDTLLVKNGVVKGFIYDLVRAQKENKNSTGNAARGYNVLPSVGISNFQIKPGRKEIIPEIDKGLLLYSPLNAHSINSITGDFSLGVMEALWIEKGEIKFAPKHVMISGNVFDLLKNIKLIGKDVIQTGSLVSPSIVAKTQIIGE